MLNALVDEQGNPINVQEIANEQEGYEIPATPTQGPQ